MSLPIKLICKKSKVRKDGSAPIFIQYCHSSEKRTLLKTDVSIPPIYWNRKSSKISKDLPIMYGKVEELETLLRGQFRKAEDLVLKAQHSGQDPIVFLKAHFHAGEIVETIEPKPVREKDFFEHIDDYMKSKSKVVKPVTITVIRSMSHHLKCYQEFLKKPITFESIDIQFYEDFVYFLTHKIEMQRRKTPIIGLRINTIGKTIKYLKNFLLDRMRKKIIPFFDVSFLKVINEEVDAIYLGWKEIAKIYHLDLSEHTHLEKYRDLFVVGCLTGFRFSDYSELRPEEIRDGMLHVIQEKTKAIVVVPMRPEIQKILIGKYNMQMPQTTNPEFNRYIKEVAKLAGLDTPIKIVHKKGNQTIAEIRPKYAWVCSHTCRRSFCTNEYLESTPIDLIMAISGHKTEKSFRRYVKATQVQQAMKIKDLWLKRELL
ncbi:site-specific integrase [Rhizosphaericola mali]|nr:site-specific integrase [Rhizosphaericola mali]